MARLFDERQYDWTRTVDSFWETGRPTFPSVDAPCLEGEHTTEVAIIGGGYCGLSAAYHLARAGIEATVLEAGPIGWGASGRNGGFCSVGASFFGPIELKEIYGEHETERFYAALVDAVRLVEQLAQDEGFDLHRQGDGVWTFAHKPNRVGELEAQAAILTRLRHAARIVPASEFEATVFRCSEQHGALFESVGFGLNPLAYCLGLASATARRGAKLHGHSRVTAWRREHGAHRLVTETASLTAKRVIVATNGWMPEEIAPELAGRVLPLLSNIIATRPMTAEELAQQNWLTECPTSNTRSLLAYLRMTPDKRLLFGGRGDTTGTEAGGRMMKRSLERYMARLFPGFDGMPITHSWRGFIAATTRLTPAVGELPEDPSVSYAFGCHGNGVAFMTWAGRELALRIADKAGALPAPLIGLPDPFPMPALRRWWLRIRLAQAWFEDTFR